MWFCNRLQKYSYINIIYHSLKNVNSQSFKNGVVAPFSELVMSINNSAVFGVGDGEVKN